MGGLHSLEVMLLRDLRMKASLIIFRTLGLERTLSKGAIKELMNMSIEFARRYGSDPEILVNPTIDEEIEAMKRTNTDIAVVSSLTNPIHTYNREGIKTFDAMKFMIHNQRVGFECPIELAMQMRKALRQRKRSPLLSLLEYDRKRANLTPQWAKLADMFKIVREGAIGDKVKVLEGT